METTNGIGGRWIVRGSATGGWDKAVPAPSRREALRIAADMRSGYDPSDSQARVTIERDGEERYVWRGSAETRAWFRAVAFLACVAVPSVALAHGGAAHVHAASGATIPLDGGLLLAVGIAASIAVKLGLLVARAVRS